MKATLLNTVTEDKIILNGLLKDGSKDKPAIILIHGFCSDFYSHKFPIDIQESLSKSNLASISIQTRGTGIKTEFIKETRRSGIYIGSAYEELNEAHLDISAWIDTLKQLGFSRFILAGHSLGTIKSVRYMFEGEHKKDIEKLILLAPFDKNGYIKEYTNNMYAQFVEESRKEVSNGNGDKLIPDIYDEFPMSYKTYISWYENTELSNIWDFYKNNEYDGTLLRQLDIPIQIIVGDSDEFFYIPKYSTLETTKKILIDNIKDLDLNIISDAGHTFVGFEYNVVNSILNFV